MLPFQSFSCPAQSMELAWLPQVTGKVYLQTHFFFSAAAAQCHTAVFTFTCFYVLRSLLEKLISSQGQRDNPVPEPTGNYKLTLLHLSCCRWILPNQALKSLDSFFPFVHIFRTCQDWRQREGRQDINRMVLFRYIPQLSSDSSRSFYRKAQLTQHTASIRSWTAALYEWQFSTWAQTTEKYSFSGLAPIKRNLMRSLSTKQ